MNSNSYQTRDESQLRVAVREEQVSVAPENEVKIQVAVINESPREDYVKICKGRLPVEWMTIEPPAIRLAAGEAKQVILTIGDPLSLRVELPVPIGYSGHQPGRFKPLSDCTCPCYSRRL